MTKLAYAALVALVLTAPISRAQQPPKMPDMEKLMKLAMAPVIHFHIEGQRDGKVGVPPWDPYSQLDIVDRVILDFDWNSQTATIIGHGQFQNVATVVKGTSSSPPCLAPVLKGAYEFLDVKEFLLPDGTAEIVLKGARSFPAADVATQCPSATQRLPVAAKQEQVEERFPIETPGVMLQGAGASSNVKIAPDYKSYTVKPSGTWVWTYTPTAK